MRTLIGGLILFSTWLAPSLTLACGGFFCDGAPTSVVDQTAEQIIFAQDDTGQGVTYIQIRYTGNVANFGWIVPVKQVPSKIELGTVNPFNDLSSVTAPRFIAPSGRTAQVSDTGPSCGAAVAPSAPSNTGSEADTKSTVDVIQQGTFGDFNYAVLQSGKASDLYQWLNDRNYNAPAAAMDIVQTYLDEQNLFIALKLQPDATIQDIQPIKITFPTFDPCIPLRLTAIAAQPGMGVLVYILGDNKAGPDSYQSLALDYSQVMFSSPSSFGPPVNYKTVVTNAVQDAGGHAFVTEYAQATQAVLAQGASFTPETTDILTSSSYLTRLYTVLSPEDMTVDPTFAFFAGGGDVSNVHNLSATSVPQSTPTSSASRPRGGLACAIGQQAYLAVMLAGAALMRHKRLRVGG